MTNHRPSTPPDELRRQAELLLRGDAATPPDLDLPDDLRAALRTVYQELHVHQIELRLQNDELQRSQRAADEAHRKYRELFDHAPVGYLTVDRTGSVLDANLTVARQLRLERPRLLGQRLSRFVPDAHVTTLALFLRRTFDRPGPGTVELPLARTDGSTFHAQIEAVVTPGDDEGGAARVTITDISAQKLAQDEVLRLNRSLETRVEERTADLRVLNEELEMVVQVATTELLSPLHAVRGFAQRLLTSQDLDEARRERSVTNILSGLERMDALVVALQRYFRVSRQRAHFRTVDLNVVAREALKDVASQFEGREVRVTVEDLPVVRGDSGMLQEALTQLLSNAVKFTRNVERPRIFVCARQLAREVAVCVEDNARYKGKLFSVFGRLHRDEEFEGAGVGLAIVRRTVQRHGGRVWAEGKAGQGATFWMALPSEGNARRGDGRDES